MRNYPEWVIGLLGRAVDRCDRRQHERVVDGQRDGVRPQDSGSGRADRRRRAATSACARCSRRSIAHRRRHPRRGPLDRPRHLDRCDGTSPDPGSLPEVDIAPDDDSTILYTSGTTGFPKGAVGSHRNHITNITNTILGGAMVAVMAPPSADGASASGGGGARLRCGRSRSSTSQESPASVCSPASAAASSRSTSSTPSEALDTDRARAVHRSSPACRRWCALCSSIPMRHP